MSQTLEQAYAGTNFARACQNAGVYFRGCGLGSVALLEEWQTGILPVMNARKKGKGTNELGVLIRHGLMQMVPDGSGYAMTPKGRQWLVDLRFNKLLPQSKPN